MKSIKLRIIYYIFKIKDKKKHYKTGSDYET